MIEQCSKEIELSVNALNQSKLVGEVCLTIDEYLSIFMYVIAKSAVKDLEAHLFVVACFVDEYVLYT